MLCRMLSISSAVKWSWPAASETPLVFHLSLSPSFPHLSNHYILSSLLLSAYTCSSSSCSLPPNSSTEFQWGSDLPQPVWVSRETELPGVLTQYSRAGTALHKHLNNCADGSWKKSAWKLHNPWNLLHLQFASSVPNLHVIFCLQVTQYLNTSTSTCKTPFWSSWDNFPLPIINDYMSHISTFELYLFF